ncbi:hypothetical protein ABFS82_14G214700 [Erythranthe guttata]|uniref:Uncharacterized protein n=1 Tax=Erythranthe guttata TaxID=4155 RepID=A0A022PQM4_ERYGU|nr:PREDICTED: uncharacterized protein LOC105950259 [Erythranthe guttata]EYU18021.1 hypothetical protein MIMGU_mgv1a006895mg [Erythranthe guttata]|eukprot:XP_012829067.1 PREDICTED: uncharacterized protein LOC105950259 [Erythranthe guttata]
MAESDEHESTFGSVFPPSLVYLTPFTPSASPSPRRLSSCFTQATKPIRAKRQLAWVSLQGRLVGAEEATSAKSVDRNGAFSPREAAAWELFTPIQRVLLVAVVAAAAANSEKNRRILKLQKSVQLRDQVLLSMQQKLDNLCQQVDYFKDQTEFVSADDDVTVAQRMNCSCKPCQHHIQPPDDVVLGNKSESNGDEVFKYKYKMPLENNVVEPDERRMSDLSDWAPSVASSVDIQLDNFVIEHDIRNLQKECEEKDAIIKKLSTSIQSSQVSSSKRNVELEDIIRRKNTIINKLRKDIMFLEHKVMNLSRLRRRSSFSGVATASPEHPPFMAENVLYDMDNTTSASSDSDSSPVFKSREICVETNEKAKLGQLKKSCVRSPLKELPLNCQTPNTVLDLKPKNISSGENRIRRRPPPRSKEVNAPKRWL